MAQSQVKEFVWDDDNEEELMGHGLTPEDVESLLDARWILRRNRRGRRGSHRIIGRDQNGRILSVPVEAMPGVGVWRPVTGWQADGEDLAIALQERI